MTEQTNTEGKNVCKSSETVTAQLIQLQKKNVGVTLHVVAYLSIRFWNCFWRFIALSAILLLA